MVNCRGNNTQLLIWISSAGVFIGHGFRLYKMHYSVTLCVESKLWWILCHIFLLLGQCTCWWVLLFLSMFPSFCAVGKQLKYFCELETLLLSPMCFIAGVKGAKLEHLNSYSLRQVTGWILCPYLTVLTSHVSHMRHYRPVSVRQLHSIPLTVCFQTNETRWRRWDFDAQKRYYKIRFFTLIFLFIYSTTFVKLRLW